LAERFPEERITGMIKPSQMSARTGLVSVTFRHLTPPEIIAAAARNGLELIEWGGDIHVPHGDTVKAREVGGMTRDAGLEVAAYGSYYRLGTGEVNGIPFERVVETAETLGAPVIRVWAGEKGSDAAEESLWESVCIDAERTATMAAGYGMKVALEFHGGTLNDTPASALRLWKQLNHPALRSLWQPLPTLSPSEQDESLSVVLPHLSHVHVFQWLPGPPIERRPLEEGTTEWSRWISRIRCHSDELTALLEFVVDDDLSHLKTEAETLRRLIGS